MERFTLKEIIFDMVFIAIAFLLMDYFLKGDNFSWSYQIAKGAVATVICVIFKRLFFYYQPKNK